MSLSDSGTGDAMQQSLSLSQQQQLTVRQLQSLKILACTNQELESLLVQEYLENPLLECSIDKQSELIHNIEHLYEKGTTYGEHFALWQEEDSDRSGDVAKKEHEDHIRALKGQLDPARYSRRDWDLIDYLIRCLDEKGFFPFDETLVAKSAGCSVARIRSLLTDLKQLEPAGVFSRDIGECLLAQLRAKGETDETLLTIVTRPDGNWQVTLNAAHPLSDEKISALLAEEGLRVPRRTIAKYRIALGIPDSRKRVRP